MKPKSDLTRRVAVSAGAALIVVEALTRSSSPTVSNVALVLGAILILGALVAFLQAARTRR